MRKDDPEYHKMHAVIADAASMHKNDLKFVEVDTDELFKVTQQFDIETVPALLLMNQRQERFRAEGLQYETLQKT